jgi:cobalt-zinc-cadmium efflux system membrane fusion protein
LIILVAALAIAAGADLYYESSREKAAETDAEHSRGDADEHGHEEHEDDHAEGAGRGHGDSDEHSHDGDHGHDHGGEKGDGEHAEQGHGDETKIGARTLEKLDIGISEVGDATIRETLRVSGRVTFNQNTTAQVKARFPGVIRSVSSEPGLAVREGDTLATVESNDSLQVYPVKAPVSGTVVSRNANIGEIAGETPLFVIADLGTLWAELSVFSKDAERVKAGQKVRITCLDDPLSVESTVALVLPAAEATSQTVVARAVIDNADGHWRAGMNIRADIVLSEKEVPVAVKAEAIQRMEGKTVVFVQEADAAFKAQPVEIGSTDAEWAEVKSGLSPGQRYVARNSFLIKADIGKAGAEHEH